MEGAIPGTGGSLRRRLLAALAALVSVVPIIAGVVITSGSTAAQASRAAPYIPSQLHAPPPSLQPTFQSNPGLPPGHGTLVALVRRTTTIRSGPAGRRLAKLTTHTEFGSPEAMWVVARARGWLGVISPLVGNGAVGWIERGAVSLSRVSWELKVSLSARRLTVLDDGKVVQRYTVAVGRPQAPTPTGRFAVTDRLNTNDPSGPYGCCILALSAHSPHAIQGWSGGNRIAIHSTPDTASIGQAASHGCVRVTIAEGRWLLAHIPLGTPTLIST
jgi:lipoprotein-anchoring transpeptidase ErfK/SrfK